MVFFYLSPYPLTSLLQPNYHLLLLRPNPAHHHHPLPLSVPTKGIHKMFENFKVEQKNSSQLSYSMAKTIECSKNTGMVTAKVE